MKHGRKLQIDVLGPVENQDDIIECRLIVDGRWCKFYTSRDSYEALMDDGLFIRYGKERDSANVLNTTRVFQEIL
jgi:hypothetical protein